MSLQVKWNNSLSGEVKVTQGVRQGAKLSTMLYKRYNNNILKALERSEIGAEIGNIKVMAPTCADDIAVLAENQHEVQALLDIVENCTKRDLVTINPNKSDLVPITKCQSNFSVYLGKDEITQKRSSRQDSKYCHLLTSRSGASRGCGRPIDNNISRNLLHNKETLEFKILESMAKRNGQSYIIKVIQRLEKYGLPEIETLLENESDTLKWKKTVKKHIIHYWDVKWQEEKQQKSTLKLLNIQSHAIGNAHQIWKSVPNCHIEIRRRTEKTLEHSKVLYRKHKKRTYKDLEKDEILMKLILDSTCESVRTSIHLKRTTILILNK
ncbi:unnamed protein product [Mytilus edulis]|uniref:Reverse transcriptase domain-containing protein n=1 Tax=Mytilus edulis TaxID=6550 RepID=A0A8S3QWS6_MYTED|nr:unnamed protein product [Mytilus edulis]